MPFFLIKINRERLLQEIARSSIVTLEGYPTYIEPILKGLEEENVIKSERDHIEILPAAWKVVSEYYLDERRHSDNQRALRRQVWLTCILAAAAIANIFREDVRSAVELLVRWALGAH